MGQLQTKKVGTAPDGSSELQKVDYSYNIRGWLTGINDTQNLEDNDAAHPDLFAFKINYNTLDNNQTDVKKLYNGNIAETRWRTDFDNLTRSYGYTYDALNRLTNAQYVRPSNPANPNSADIIDTFNETLSYDKNGNIQKLVRNGGLESQTTVPVMDNLKYIYDTNDKNKLLKVTDITTNTDGFKDGADTQEEYGYDGNGNMTRDDNKNIRSIVYNHLNLPTQIVFQNGGDFPSISYLYTATGKKVAKTVDIASRNRIYYTVDYLDGFQYESEKLLFFPTAEGYVKYTEGVDNPFDYVYNYTDHLGNIRLSYGINPATGLLKKMEENNYYPFGLKHATYNTESIIIVPRPRGTIEEQFASKYMKLKEESIIMEGDLTANATANSGYNYKYNGKELQDELGLNLYDYGARNYDPALGRWMNVDPLAEKYYNLTTYNYVADNPITNIDPDGNDIIFVVTKGDNTRNFQYRKGNFYELDNNGKFSRRYNPGKSVSPTMYKVLSTYRKIEKSNNSKLKSVLHKLEKSKLHHYVEEGNKSVVSPFGVPSTSDTDSPVGTRTSFNFSNEDDAEFEKSEGTIDSDDATVAHEMRHQFDYDIGNMADNKDENTEKDPSEIRAVFFENLMRLLLQNIKIRPNYDKPIDPELLKNPPNNRF